MASCKNYEVFFFVHEGKEKQNTKTTLHNVSYLI